MQSVLQIIAVGKPVYIQQVSFNGYISCEVCPTKSGMSPKPYPKKWRLGSLTVSCIEVDQRTLLGISRTESVRAIPAITRYGRSVKESRYALVSILRGPTPDEVCLGR
jgi:hypothetical protein